jgi:hypothetical protein
MRIDAKAKCALVPSAFLSTMLLLSEAPQAGEQDDAPFAQDAPRVFAPVFPVAHYSPRRPMSDIAMPSPALALCMPALALCMPDLYCSLGRDSHRADDQKTLARESRFIRAGVSR